VGYSTIKGIFTPLHCNRKYRLALASTIIFLLCSCDFSASSPTPTVIFFTPSFIDNQSTTHLSRITKTTTPINPISINHTQTTNTPTHHPPKYQFIQPENIVSLVPILIIHYEPWSPILSLSWSHAGDALAVSAAENIYIYKSKNWEEEKNIFTGTWVTSLDFDPQNRWIVASSRDGLVRFWALQNYSSEHQPNPLAAHKKAVNQVIFNPDGDMFATAGNDGIARIWHTETGKRLSELIGGSYAIPAIAFVDQGKSLAIVNNKTIRIRDINSTRFVKTLRSTQPLQTIVISPDGNKMAGGSLENIIQVWDLYTETELFTIQGHQGVIGQTTALVWDVSYSPNGQLLATGGGDTTLRIWNTSNGHQLAKLTVHTAAVTCVAFSPDGKYLVSGGMDSQLIIWGIYQNQ